TKTPHRCGALLLALVLGSAVLAGPGTAQQGQQVVHDPSLYDALEYRYIGPDIGARAIGFAGIPEQPYTFYMGSAGGGIWKTEDAGHSWRPISDGQLEANNIGALAVAPSDVNVIYAGTGETTIRGNIVVGRGLYRSTDAGDTWTFMGLEDAGQIGDIVVHPRNADLLYVAALGHPFRTNPERGVFRSEDGGETWENVLFVSDSTGAVDLSMNPSNPREIYAAMWRAERKPWTLISGSTEGGLFKTTDGGDTWTELGGGFPEGLIGKIGVDVSPADPDRVWALVEAEGERGGLYRSDDRGATWRLLNNEAGIRSRPFYYTHVHAHPTDRNTVFAATERAWRSNDGGATFETFETLHVDQHGFWINPLHPEIIAVVNDGGMQISLNDTETWSPYILQGITEIYRVFVDDQFPYWVYGSVQDFDTIILPSWVPWAHIDAYERFQYWRGAGGGESGDIQIDPRDPNVTYAGSGNGTLDRVNRATGEVRSIRVYPERQGDRANAELKYRFQWNAPVRLQPQDPDVLYTTSQFVHRSADQGDRWEVISPDLTRGGERPETMGTPGGPITHDVTSVEMYNTIFAFEPSPYDPQVMWAGSDDGLVHVTRDGGATWTDITPGDLPEWATVNTIELSAHAPGRAIVTVHNYRMGDELPYAWLTDDYGASWTRIADGTRGLPDDAVVRVVREDPERRGLLYAGTHRGMYVSFDEGARWQSLQLNLPVMPVLDLKVHRGDLVLATQGRGFWILDDATPLRQMTDEVEPDALHLFRPRDAYAVDIRYSDARGWHEAPPSGAVFTWVLPRDAGEGLTLRVLDAAGDTVRVLSSDSTSDAYDEDLPTGAGSHRFAWPFRHGGIDVPSGGAFSGTGPRALPGTYAVELELDGEVRRQEFRLLADPRRDDLTEADLREQLGFSEEVSDTVRHLYDAVRAVRAMRDQVRAVAEAAEVAEAPAAIGEAADTLVRRLTVIEARLIESEAPEAGDLPGEGSRLDEQYAFVFSNAQGSPNRPTRGSYERFADLNQEWTAVLQELRTLVQDEVARFNERVREAGVTGVIVPGALR
ncbi:MAG: glycosyl hydrolase, partial [Gemmatimonadota bacterium]